ncbi:MULTISPECIES: hypothetical protein [Haloferax]|uniref:Uncharacterized protein n=1 Tax=Haloferax marinum TaxID=2666143 RepID=A0A6A8G4V8_9EURY|nr:MULTISPECIES: hypothetical protein [Haloferax]KAB1196618.1 hypothetical protein Hfx1150_03420 [Haloferax sp. CBA1150]MRW95622.1 hypothetical protein [Haloferax marinum]
MSERAVSTTLGFVLTLSITTILISGIMVGAGGYVSTEHERVTETELEVVGQRLAANIESVDRVASSSGDETVRTVSTRLELPNRVAGTTYRISVDPASSELVLRSVDPEVTVRIAVETTVPLESGSVDAGVVTVTYDDADGKLEVAHG